MLKDVVELELFLIPCPALKNTSPTLAAPLSTLKNPLPALVVPCPSLENPLHVNKFPNKEGPKVPNNMPNVPPFCFFISFLIVLLTPFNKIFESSKA